MDTTRERLKNLCETFEKTNQHLETLANHTAEIAQGVKGFRGFVKNWLPWCIAAAGLLFPNLKFILDKIPI